MTIVLIYIGCFFLHGGYAVWDCCVTSRTAELMQPQCMPVTNCWEEKLGCRLSERNTWQTHGFCKICSPSISFLSYAYLALIKSLKLFFWRIHISVCVISLKLPWHPSWQQTSYNCSADIWDVRTTSMGGWMATEIIHWQNPLIGRTC